MAKLTVQIIEIEGEPKSLRIDVARVARPATTRGVDIGWPVDPDVLDVAAQSLLENLAGISKSEIVLAALKTLHPEIA